MPLTWSHTFEPGPDFAAHDGDQPVGRIWKHKFGTVKGRWWWGANGIHMDPRMLGFPLYGEVATKAEAVEAVCARGNGPWLGARRPGSRWR